ncbi:MAG: hypothetical protein ACFFBJ_00635 [Promethearchaeota archaeon]
MVSRRSIVIVLGLMGCSLLGVGVAETAWGLLFPPTGDFIYDVVTPVLMVIFGILLLLITNRIHLDVESE